MHSIELERISHLGAPSDEGSSSAACSAPSRTRTPTGCGVCEVDTGDGTRTIVCGAPNVAAGQTVAVVTPGARMPGGEKLKRRSSAGSSPTG